ncbi:MAG: response regulator transcription factor [Opitutaceae bacterium]|nr:response regulator transcription factor [Cytophagales bacterium]
MNKITLVIADDHKIIRDGLKALLSNIADFHVEGEAKDGEKLIELLETMMPDVVLIDISMPKINGLDAIKLMLSVNPATKVIVLSMHEEPDYILKAMQNGAKGYLLKNIDEKELEIAIRTVAAGGKYYNSEVSSIMMENLSRPPVLKMNSEMNISARELEVLKLVADGLSNKMIADKLDISMRTVETHRLNMLKKLQVSNAAELIKKAITMGLL